VSILNEIGVMPKKSFRLLDLSGVEYFRFEEDFVEENVRCIPMIVRFKMDAAGIKLKLEEWCKFSVDERAQLARKKCVSPEEVQEYRTYLKGLVWTYTSREAADMKVDQYPSWADDNIIPEELQTRLTQEQIDLKIDEWRSLQKLQRFALLKLSRPGHESKNFLKALDEFGVGSNRKK
jgi:hypothetical protein